MRKKTDPELPMKPPLWMGNHSNGEYFRPATAHDRKLEKFVFRTADEKSRRLGMDRREFLASTMGMATTLWCIQHAAGCSSSTTAPAPAATTGPSHKKADGGLCVPPEAMLDENAACDAIGGNEFIFDVQTHWFNQADTTRFPASVNAAFGLLFSTANEAVYINQMFLNSETTMAVLTAWPGSTCSDDPSNTDPCGLPLSNESMQKSRDHINALACGTQRVVQHVQVLPNDLLGIEKQIEIMDQFHCEKLAYGWKMYPGFATSSIDPARGGPGYFLDEPKPRQIIEHGLQLGLNRFCVHKGLPIGNFFEAEHNHPKDVGVVAKDYPEANFVIYHSAICAGHEACGSAAPEGPYSESDPDPKGVNALIRSLLDNGIKPNSNVYAEVGSALNQIQNNPDAAQHFFGKLMKYVGVDRVVWGTDCVIYGSPDQFIRWFRTLEISQALQDEHGYPPLDAEAKAKIFGLNSAKLYDIDVEAKRCQVNACPTALLKKRLDEEFGPGRATFDVPGGPKTWAEYSEHSRRVALSGRPG
jgi:predicted TIM-barrel fold metal-dependent hydrolase